MHRPSCRYGWFSQPTQPQVFVTTTTAHGSLAPNGLCCPIPPRSSDPIRQSRRLPPLSQDHWLYRRSLPDILLWAASETFPALGPYSFLTCRHPYAERRSEGPQSPLASRGVPPQNTESAPLFPLTSAPVRALLTTLQCSLHATARKVAGPPGLVRPRALSGRRGRLHPSLPGAGYLDPESGITTQPSWGRTVTGLTPAGVLPLQAARSVAKFTNYTIC